MRLVLKTMVSNKAEIPFLWMMFSEAAPFVDKIFLTEFNATHSGLPRDFIFHEHVDEFQAAFPQLEYLQGLDIPDVIYNGDTADDHHHNEKLMRGWFAHQVKLSSRDVVFSTDADEVLYGSTYQWVLDNFTWRTRNGVKFRLHQFFYRPNYLWVDHEFVAPVALRFGHYNREFPNQWRYQGLRLPGYWGAHFSWCIPLSEMEKKVVNYSHASEHKHVRGRGLFDKAREEKFFPFSDRPFRLEEISFDSPILPESFFTHAHRLEPEVLGEGLNPFALRSS